MASVVHHCKYTVELPLISWGKRDFASTGHAYQMGRWTAADMAAVLAMTFSSKGDILQLPPTDLLAATTHPPSTTQASPVKKEGLSCCSQLQRSTYCSTCHLKVGGTLALAFYPGGSGLGWRLQGGGNGILALWFRCKNATKTEDVCFKQNVCCKL